MAVRNVATLWVCQREDCGRKFLEAGHVTQARCLTCGGPVKAEYTRSSGVRERGPGPVTDVGLALLLEAQR